MSFISPNHSLREIPPLLCCLKLNFIPKSPRTHKFPKLAITQRQQEKPDCTWTICSKHNRKEQNWKQSTNVFYISQPQLTRNSSSPLTRKWHYTRYRRTTTSNQTPSQLMCYTRSTISASLLKSLLCGLPATLALQAVIQRMQPPDVLLLMSMHESQSWILLISEIRSNIS